MANIELPRDAEGREIPLDTTVLYDSCGNKVSVKEFLSRTLVESQRTGWTIKAQYEDVIDYNSFKPKNMHLTPPDSWEKLEEDLGRGVTTLSFNDAECDYFGRGSGYDRCKGCPAGKRSSCTVAMLEDVATRIRKLRGEDR